MINVRPAQLNDVCHVAVHIHPDDAREIKVALGDEPMPALVKSFQASADGEIFAVCPIFEGVEQRPVAVFGCISEKATHEIGVIWLVSTPMLLSTSKDMLKKAPEIIKGFLKRHPKGLHNIMAAFNTRHMKWVHKLGAKFVFVKQPIKIKGESFVHFIFPPELAL